MPTFFLCLGTLRCHWRPRESRGPVHSQMRDSLCPIHAKPPGRSKRGIPSRLLSTVVHTVFSVALQSVVWIACVPTAWTLDTGYCRTFTRRSANHPHYRDWMMLTDVVRYCCRFRNHYGTVAHPGSWPQVIRITKTGLESRYCRTLKHLSDHFDWFPKRNTLACCTLHEEESAGLRRRRKNQDKYLTTWIQGVSAAKPSVVLSCS